MTPLDTAIEAARDAGAILRRFLGRIRTIEIKNNEPTNLVTEADKASEHRIIEVIRQRFPRHSILCEESGLHDQGSSHRWIIDPLDGTTNYTHALPLFSISIALEIDGVVDTGVVYDPTRDELFHATRGGGAFLNGRPIRVSSVTALQQAMLVTGFPYNVTENPDFCHERFLLFLQRAQAVRRLGSAALDAAYVAAGRLDGFWEVALQPWDKAAGVLLIEEAGGRVSAFDGSPHSLFSPPFLASNGGIHDDMVHILREAESVTIRYAP